MKERPILFSDAMVRAILDGRKTQTRRLCRPTQGASPYGEPGDRLWVRETFSGPHSVDNPPPSQWGHDCPIWYWADGDPESGDWSLPRPSIHMPRWASRITLEITDIRVQRLQEISAEDAKAEGSYLDRCPCLSRRADKTFFEIAFKQHECHIHGSEFSYLWDRIHGKGSWNENPWVWVISFRRT